MNEGTRIRKEKVIYLPSADGARRRKQKDAEWVLPLTPIWYSLKEHSQAKQSILWGFSQNKLQAATCRWLLPLPIPTADLLPTHHRSAPPGWLHLSSDSISRSPLLGPTETEATCAKMKVTAEDLICQRLFLDSPETILPKGQISSVVAKLIWGKGKVTFL